MLHHTYFLASSQPDEHPLPFPAFPHARLVRLCAYFSGDPQAAEDLAQETLIEAWRNAHKLYDTQGYGAWLAAIARNVCRRWARHMGQESAIITSTNSDADWPPDSIDLEVELERGELAVLLDRALALLPAETRAVLIARYIHESSLAEVAGRMGLSEGNVAVRLHRGKLALRRVLATDLHSESVEFGLISQSETLHPTRLWCPSCGAGRLAGRLNAQAGDLHLRCPLCYRAYGADFRRMTGLPRVLKGAKGFRVALKRAIEWSSQYLAQCLEANAGECVYCGRPIRPWVANAGRTGPYLDLSCSICPSVNTHSLQNRVLATPVAQGFWRAHSRIRRLPERPMEAEGAAALLTGWESVTSAVRLELLVSSRTFALLRVVRHD